MQQYADVPAVMLSSPWLWNQAHQKIDIMAGMAEFENLIKSMGVEDEGMVTQAQQVLEFDLTALTARRYGRC